MELDDAKRHRSAMGHRVQWFLILIFQCGNTIPLILLRAILFDRPLCFVKHMCVTRAVPDTCSFVVVIAHSFYVVLISDRTTRVAA